MSPSRNKNSKHTNDSPFNNPASYSIKKSISFHSLLSHSNLALLECPRPYAKTGCPGLLTGFTRWRMVQMRRPRYRPNTQSPTSNMSSTWNSANRQPSVLPCESPPISNHLWQWRLISSHNESSFPWSKYPWLSALWRAILVPYFHYEHKALKLYYFPKTDVFWPGTKSGRDLHKSPALFPMKVKNFSSHSYWFSKGNLLF